MSEKWGGKGDFIADPLGNYGVFRLLHPPSFSGCPLYSTTDEPKIEKNKKNDAHNTNENGAKK